MKVVVVREDGHPEVAGVPLRVQPVYGEPTRFHVESSSAECVVCGRLYKRYQWKHDPDLGCHARVKRKKVVIGGPCPYRMGCAGTLDVKFHLVDVAECKGHGFCSCEWFQFDLWPKLSRTPPTTWPSGLFRCRHIKAAREFALDLSIAMLERDRLRNAKPGQQEGGV